MNLKEKKHSLRKAYLAYWLYVSPKTKWLYWGWLFSQSEVFESFQIPLIGWIKVGPPKRPLFWICKQLYKYVINL